jgi:hypothetical protein
MTIRYDKLIRILLCLLVVFFLAECTLWCTQITPFLDIVANRSQSHSLEIETEYFIDQEKYFYVILFHMHTAIFIGIFSLIAMAALLIAYVQHICAMFKIAWYELRYETDNSIK